MNYIHKCIAFAFLFSTAIFTSAQEMPASSPIITIDELKPELAYKIKEYVITHELMDTPGESVSIQDEDVHTIHSMLKGKSTQREQLVQPSNLHSLLTSAPQKGKDSFIAPMSSQLQSSLIDKIKEEGRLTHKQEMKHH